eukprot:6507078-Prymnesium_polylepis.2
MIRLGLRAVHAKEGAYLDGLLEREAVLGVAVQSDVRPVARELLELDIRVHGAIAALVHVVAVHKYEGRGAMRGLGRGHLCAAR